MSGVCLHAGADPTDAVTTRFDMTVNLSSGGANVISGAILASQEGWVIVGNRGCFLFDSSRLASDS